MLPPDPAVHPCLWPVPIAEDEPFGHGSLWVPGQPAVAQPGWPGRCWAPALGQLSPGTARPRCPGCVPEAAQSTPQEHQRSRCFLCGSLNFTPANNGKGSPVWRENPATVRVLDAPTSISGFLTANTERFQLSQRFPARPFCAPCHKPPAQRALRNPGSFELEPRA